MIYTPLSLLLIAVPTFPQAVGGGSEALHQFGGAALYDSFGVSVSGAGDIDGDGFADLIVGAPYTDLGGIQNVGSVYAYSGASGLLLYQWDGSSFDHFGENVSAAGDVNGDGFSDVIVGAHFADPGGRLDSGSAYVYSGADGSLLYQWNGGAVEDRFGSSVSGVGDANGDGFADVIVGAIYADPGGRQSAGSAFLYSGANGSLLYQWDGTAAYDQLGESIAGAGDVNGDGFADVIVGAGYTDIGGMQSAGSAYVFSGVDGSLLHQWDGEVDYDAFGYRVSAAGDVNGDGFADVIIGAELANRLSRISFGSAYVYSGADGALLYQWYGEGRGDYYGESISGAGDVNGDGFSDVIVGAPFADPGGRRNAGSAYLYSGLDGSLLHQWDGRAVEDFYGESVSGARDVNGDGFSDVIVGARFGDVGVQRDSGSAHVYSFQPFLRTNTTAISASTGGVLNLTLDFPNAAASQEYISLVSALGTGPIHYGIDIPLSLDTYLLDSAVGIYPFAITSNLHGTLDAAGNATASITFPAGVYNFAIGRTFWLAAVSFPIGQLPAHSSVVLAFKIVP